MKNNELVKYLTEKKTSIRTSIPVQTLRNKRHEKKGIPFIKFGKSVRYAVEDIEYFMEYHTVEVKNNF